jgi:hypothetical protein
MKDFKSAEERSAWIIKNAEMFTAVKFLGRGKYERHEYPSLEKAIEGADVLIKANGGRYMLYAVCQGHDTYIMTRG